jgi:vacuolar-type H+-ATPase subunit I/STV1
MKKLYLLTPDGSDGGNEAEAAKAKAKKEAEAKAKSEAEETERLKIAIEKARLEERTKLREDISATEKRLTDSTLTIEQQKAEISNLKTAVEALQKTAKEGEKIDVQKLVTEITERTNELARKNYDAQVADLNKQLTALQVRLLRESLIKEVGEDNLVVAMISGRTEQELRDSVERSKAEMDKIKAKIGAQSKAKSKKSDDSGEEEDDEETVNGDNDDDNSSDEPPPRLSDSGSGGVGKGRAGTLLKSVKQMDPSEYARNRAKVLADIQRRYPRKAV